MLPSAIQTPRQSAVKRSHLMPTPPPHFHGAKSLFTPLPKCISTMARKTEQHTITDKTIQELHVEDEDEEVMFDALRQESSFIEQPYSNSQRTILKQLQICIDQTKNDNGLKTNLLKLQTQIETEFKKSGEPVSALQTSPTKSKPQIKALFATLKSE